MINNIKDNQVNFVHDNEFIFESKPNITRKIVSNQKSILYFNLETGNKVHDDNSYRTILLCYSGAYNII